MESERWYRSEEQRVFILQVLRIGGMKIEIQKSYVVNGIERNAVLLPVNRSLRPIRLALNHGLYY
jgi:hypothetical protein